MEENFLVDDCLSIEIQVKIKKMTGVYSNLRSFDASMKKLSDVVLVVGGEKFYVSKLYLATHSPYFQALFHGHFEESKKPEISLSGINSEDFQNYLEALYGDRSIIETTVEGILLVADMFDTPTIIEKCEEFLLEKSQKSNKKKLLMAMKYGLRDLKEICLSEIKTMADIKSVISGSVKDLEPSIMAELLEKSISFQA